MTNDDRLGQWLTVLAVLSCLGPPLTVALIGVTTGCRRACATGISLHAACGLDCKHWRWAALCWRWLGGLAVKQGRRVALLVLAAAATPAQRWCAAIAIALVGVPTALVPSPRQSVRPETLVITTALIGHIAALAVNAWAVWAWFAARRVARVPSN